MFLREETCPMDGRERWNKTKGNTLATGEYIYGRYSAEIAIDFCRQCELGLSLNR